MSLSATLFGRDSFIFKATNVLGLGIPGYLDRKFGVPDPDDPVADTNFQTSTYGTPLPRIYGTIATPGNIFWLENNQLKAVTKKKKQGGKGGGGQTVKTIEYFATFAVSICDTSKTGEIAGIRRIWLGSVLYYNAGSNDLETVIASNANAEGFRIYYGASDQMPDPRMQADIGVDDCPAYRHTAYIVFYDLALAKYGGSLQASQAKVEVLTYGPSTVETISSTDTSDSLVHANDNTGGAFAQFIDINAGRFSIIGGKYPGSNLYKQKYTIYSPRTYSSEHIIDAAPFSTVAAKLDVDTFAYGFNSTINASYYICIGGTNYSSFSSARVATSGDLVVFYSINFISIPTIASPPEIAAEHAVVNFSYAHVDIAISDSEIYALLNDSGYLYVKVYSSDLTYLHDVDTAALNGSIITPTVYDSIFINGEEIVIYAAFDDSIIILNMDGGLIAIYSIFGKHGSGLPALNSSDIKGRLFATFNSIDKKMYFVDLDTISSSTVFLGDVVSSEMQFAGIEAADINISLLTDEVRGYKISGGSIRNAISPLQGAYPFDIIPSGYEIKCVPRGLTSVGSIPIQNLGASAGIQMAEIALDGPVREMDAQLPRRVKIKYLDADRDYDMNEQSWSRDATDSVDIESQEIPLVLLPDEARAISQVICYLRWLERDDYSFSLPPIYNHLEPSDIVDVETEYGVVPLRLPEVSYGSNNVIACKAKPNSPALYTSNATGGQGVVPDGNIGFEGDSILLLLDIPMMRSDLNEAGFVATMSGETPSWPGGVAFRSSDNGNTFDDVQGFDNSGTFGSARGALTVDSGALIDYTSTLSVDWLAGTPESITENQLLAGYGYYAYGAEDRWEIVAIANFDLQPDASYLCSTFLRGMRGTEWTTGLHENGDYLVLLDDPDNLFIGAGYDSFGVTKIWRGVTYGKSVDTASNQSFSYDGVNLKPLSPVDPVGVRDGSNNLSVTFNRRSRFTNSWWTTGVQPILGEATESYSIDVLNGAAVVRTIAVTSPAFSYSSAEQTTDFGSAQAAIVCRIYQISATVGRGYPLETTL